MRTRILIAEDDESIMMLEKRILEEAGYEVDCAVSGDQALEMARQNRYALVVADVMMPGMDGIDLTREISKIYQRSVPVLLVTAMNDALKTAHLREAKPISTLQKPFSPQSLLIAVRLLEAHSKSKAGGTKKGSSTPKGNPGAAAKPDPVFQSSPKSTSEPPKRKRSWLDRLLHPSDS